VEGNRGELAECLVTRCKQLDGLLQERGKGIFPLEADHDQVGPVELCEVEEMIATNGYTRSLGGIETPEPLVVARIPSVSVPVCVVSSVSKCVLKRTHSVGEMASVREKVCVKETPCVSGTTCASEIARVSERPCVTETACVRERYEREMAVGMRENETATACPSVMARCVSVMARGSVGVERRQRLRRLRDKDRVAAVVAMGTVPGLHGSVRMVRAVQRTRPPRARLRG